MSKRVWVSSLVATTLLPGSTLAGADSRGSGDRVERYLDHRGDRISVSTMPAWLPVANACHHMTFHRLATEPGE